MYHLSMKTIEGNSFAEVYEKAMDLLLRRFFA